MGRETPEPLAMRQQAGIVCELRKPLVQDKYSVKAKAQQLMYGVMGYIIYFDRGYNLEYNIWGTITNHLIILYIRKIDERDGYCITERGGGRGGL